MNKMTEMFYELSDWIDRHEHVVMQVVLLIAMVLLFLLYITGKIW